MTDRGSVFSESAGTARETGAASGGLPLLGAPHDRNERVEDVAADFGRRPQRLDLRDEVRRVEAEDRGRFGLVDLVAVPDDALVGVVGPVLADRPALDPVDHRLLVAADEV